MELFGHNLLQFIYEVTQKSWNEIVPKKNLLGTKAHMHQDPNPSRRWRTRMYVWFA